jgi:DNA-directed RNA polymerase subunit RPC12/RpoP
MQNKQKVTLYLPPELHRKLKIKAAVESEPMSSIAERAIIFYLTNPELVDEVETSYGQTHRVYACPECSSSIVLKEGELTSLREQPSVLADDELPVRDVESTTAQSGEELVPC